MLVQFLDNASVSADFLVEPLVHTLLASINAIFSLHSFSDFLVPKNVDGGLTVYKEKVPFANCIIICT